MRCEVEVTLREPDAIVLSVHGEVDMGNADAVAQSVKDALPEGCPRVVLALDGARYLDSSGIRMLYQLSEWAARRGVSLSLALSEASPLRRVFELTKVDMFCPVHDSVESALAAPPPQSTAAAG